MYISVIVDNPHKGRPRGCGLRPKSRAIVMSRWSVNLTTIFLGKLTLSGYPVILAHTFAIKWPQHEKTCLRGFVNNTGADQPAHLRSLISSFVIRFLERIIYNLATGEISIF